jgi:hypothetical protein
VFWNENAAECAASMIRRYKSREAAIEQAHACEVEAYKDEERAYWRAVLAELRACNENQILRKTQPKP